ncbi:MAG: hypothetical protein ABIG95_02255 [Candidatus Woesearchaeota archaeon]
MDADNLKLLIREIVEKACALKDKHTNEIKAPVNYACIFCQSREEYDELMKTVSIIGKVIHKTSMGPIFYIKPINTVSGALQLLKIRLPDSARHELGDADFTVSDYSTFKQKYLVKKGFKLLLRENFEMIELMDPDSEVLAYFSHPPLDEQFGIKK